MKIKPIHALFAVLMCIVPILNATAQEQESKTQLFTIHEDVVIPSKVAEYEKVAKNFAEFVAEQNITSMQYTAANSDDFVYIYISPLENMADLDKMYAGFQELEEKAGKERFDNVMKGFEGKYHSHRDYLIRMHPELSYKPEYGNNLADGMNYRRWDFYHVYPGKEAEIENIAKEWMALNESNNIEQGYRVYMGDMGTDMPLVIVAHSALNATDFYTNYEKNMAKMGDKAKKLMEKTMGITWKFETKDGMMRPDLSYIKPQVAQAEN